MNNIKILLLLVTTFFANTSAGIVIRHDVSDDKYNATADSVVKFL